MRHIFRSLVRFPVPAHADRDVCEGRPRPLDFASVFGLLLGVSRAIPRETSTVREHVSVMSFVTTTKTKTTTTTATKVAG